MVPLDGLVGTDAGQDHRSPSAVAPEGCLGHGYGKRKIGLEELAVDVDRGPQRRQPDELKVPGILAAALSYGDPAFQDFIAELSLELGLVHLAQAAAGHKDFRVGSCFLNGFQNRRQNPRGRRQTGKVVDEEEDLFPFA